MFVDEMLRLLVPLCLFLSVGAVLKKHKRKLSC